MTLQRSIILRVIREAGEHLTADEIYQRAKELLPTMAVGTVYRNLKLMSAEGDIVRIPSAKGPDRYDKNVFPHDHMLCRACGRYVDISVPSLKKVIERESGAKVESYVLTVEGLCPDCAQPKDGMERKATARKCAVIQLNSL